MKKKTLPKTKIDGSKNPIIISVKSQKFNQECISLSEIAESRFQKALGVHADVGHGEDGASSFKSKRG